MPAKSYIWGRISGVLSILAGFLWALNFSLGTHLDVAVYLSISTLIVIGGVLVLLKKSLGWYLMYLHLFLVGSLLLYLAASSVQWYLGDRWTLTEIIGIQVDSNPLPVISAVAAIGIGCYLLLWVQIRYWHRRKADV
jgi:hypothetical protein